MVKFKKLRATSFLVLAITLTDAYKESNWLLYPSCGDYPLKINFVALPR